MIEPCILGGTSEKGCCPKCKSPWERIVEKVEIPVTKSKGKEGIEVEEVEYELVSKGWEPTCDCGIGDTEQCLVLDPFSGTSTTGSVCFKHGRDYVGLDVNKEYLEYAKSRLMPEDIFGDSNVQEYKFDEVNDEKCTSSR